MPAITGPVIAEAAMAPPIALAIALRGYGLDIGTCLDEVAGERNRVGWFDGTDSYQGADRKSSNANNDLFHTMAFLVVFSVGGKRCWFRFVPCCLFSYDSTSGRFSSSNRHCGNYSYHDAASLTE